MTTATRGCCRPPPWPPTPHRHRWSSSTLTMVVAIHLVLFVIGFVGANSSHYRHPSSKDSDSALTNEAPPSAQASTDNSNHAPKNHGSSVDETRTADAQQQTNQTNFNDDTSNPSSVDKNQKIELLVNQHEKLTLKCEVNINFTNNIWLKDGEVVDSVLMEIANKRGASGHRYLRDRAGSLFIDNVRMEDDGKWQCEAEDAFGLVMTAKPFHVTVLEEPRKPYLVIDNRRLDPGNQFVPVRESAELAVRCVVEGGNPRPRLTWDLTAAPTPPAAAPLEAPDIPALNLTVLEDVGISSGISVTNGGSAGQQRGAVSEARLHVLRAHNNATISCLVHHATLKEPLSASLLLDVQYTPSFAISRTPGFGIPVLEGMPVSLRCDVDANPAAGGVWRRDDAPPPVAQSADGVLNFTAIRREHSGWYKCTARHPQGVFSSIGYFLNVRYEDTVTAREPAQDADDALIGIAGGSEPLSSTPRRQVEVALGGAVQLQCPAGVPGCWTRLNGNGRLEPLGASQDLRLDKVLYQEGGEYRCVAPGREHRVRSEQLKNALVVQLKVTGQPTVHPLNQTVLAMAGQTLTLHVEFCARPAHNRARWITDTHVFIPGRPTGTSRIIAHDINNITAPFCHQSRLSFKTVQPRDHGEYAFVVRSTEGVAEATVFLNVSYDSDYVQPTNNGFKTYPLMNINNNSSYSLFVYITLIYLLILKM